MAVCVYHETTQATAVCRVCKQDICGKCLEFGQDGMCGMCVEVAAARRATRESARQATRKPAAAMAAGAAPARPAAGPAAPVPPLTPPSRKAASRPGYCPEHPDKEATAACAHCEQLYCPFCLDLYDLCGACRQLPHCSRHEAMVADKRCAGCKMPYCEVCLDGSAFCDRCRARGLDVAPPKPKPASGPLPRAKSGALPRAGGEGPAKPAASGGARPGARSGGPRRGRPSAPPPPPKTLPSPKVLAGLLGVIVVLGGLALTLRGGGGGPSADSDKVSAVRTEMAYVVGALKSVRARSGALPDSAEAIKQELGRQGVSLDSLPIPTTIVLNAPSRAPFAVIVTQTSQGFEVSGLDAHGEPILDGTTGRRYVLRDP